MRTLKASSRHGLEGLTGVRKQWSLRLLALDSFLSFVIIGLLTTALPIVLIVLAVRKANFQSQALNNLDQKLA